MLEEVAIQDLADFKQQVGVDELPSEKMVHVLACVAHLLGQPCDASSLSGQFGLDVSSYVKFVFHSAFCWMSQTLESQ